MGCSTRFVEGMLEPYMRNELKSTLDQVGYAFLVDGLAYAACSLPTGVVCSVTSKNFHNLITKVHIIIIGYR